MAHTRQPVRFRYTARELAQIQGEIQTHTREYARRQMTWLKKMPAVKPVSGSEEAIAVAAHLLQR